ncbi:MAG: hypothetical protein H7A09_07635 [Oceanospirillaceae bacterium]|nr:hypothetical protein [Oceanospirillaceae bacterium]MCP5349756.1 hypothetical protein [Oceanospirillaceae bacterium]
MQTNDRFERWLEQCPVAFRSVYIAPEQTPQRFAVGLKAQLLACRVTRVGTLPTMMLGTTQQMTDVKLDTSFVDLQNVWLPVPPLYGLPGWVHSELKHSQNLLIPTPNAQRFLFCEASVYLQYLLERHCKWVPETRWRQFA